MSLLIKDQESIERTRKTLEKDLTFLMIQYPWLVMVLLNLDLRFNNTYAEVSPKYLYLNPIPSLQAGKIEEDIELLDLSLEIPNSCYFEQEHLTRKTLLLHQALHLILGHFSFSREKYDNTQLVHICQDVIVNRVLREEFPGTVSFSELDFYPKELSNSTGFSVNGVVFDGIPDYLDKDWQGLYQYIIENFDFPPPEYFEIPQADPEEIYDSEQDVLRILSSLDSSLPEFFQKKLRELTAPKINWLQYLRAMIVNSLSLNEFQFYGNSKKAHIGNLPKLTGSSQKFTVAIDTSGSISQVDLGVFLSEVKEIQRLFNADLEIIVCDQEITKIIKVDIQTPINWTNEDMPGLRGTDFRPVFDYIKQSKETPSTLVFFTDTCGDFPDYTPTYPVIWVSRYELAKVPFGTLLFIKD